MKKYIRIGGNTMEKNKYDRVPVKGTVSRETADAMRRGDLKCNNGLRQSKGRPSFNSEQPDVWIDEGPTIGQQLREGVKQDLAYAVRWEVNRIIYEEIFPRGRDFFWNRLVPFVGLKLHKLEYGENKASILLREKAGKESTTSENEVKPAGKIINFSKYRKAAGID